MEITKLMIFANLSYIQENLPNIPKWVEKKWCHGIKPGKGKKVANHELWKKILGDLTGLEIRWMWSPKGNTFKAIFQKAHSMALLPEEKSAPPEK